MNSETNQRQIAFLQAWDKFKYSDELAKIKAEEADLNYYELAVLKSELLENLV